MLERVADTVTPQPVLTVLPMLRRRRADVAGPDPVEQPLIVVLVDVRDPGNAGTVLRTADASGVNAVIFSGESVDPYNPKTVRASAGSLFHVPFSVQADPVALAASLAGAGYRTLATVVRDGDDYAALDWSVPTALFLGNEAAGLGARGAARPSEARWPSRWRAGPSPSTSAWPAPCCASRRCGSAGRLDAGCGAHLPFQC